jgi:dTDP-4-dehydrorhamnose reductase
MSTVEMIPVETCPERGEGEVEVEGTRNLVRAVLRRDLRFVHISTEYVFWGVVGGYHPDHPLGPVGNYRWLVVGGGK